MEQAEKSLPAVTNARIAPLYFASRALVTSGIRIAAGAAGFRLRLVGSVARRLRSRRHYACAPLFLLADRRPMRT